MHFRFGGGVMAHVYHVMKHWGSLMRTINRQLSLRKLMLSSLAFALGLGCFQIAVSLGQFGHDGFAFCALVVSLVLSGVGLGVPLGTLAWGRRGAICVSALIVSSLMLVGVIIPTIY